MTGLRRAWSAAFSAALAACSLAPYATVPPAPVPGAAAKGVRVALCYDGLASKRPAVAARAQRECPAGTRAQFLASDFRLNHCPLLLPARATFLCAPVAQ